MTVLLSMRRRAGAGLGARYGRTRTGYPVRVGRAQRAGGPWAPGAGARSERVRVLAAAVAQRVGLQGQTRPGRHLPDRAAGADQRRAHVGEPAEDLLVVGVRGRPAVLQYEPLQLVVAEGWMQ